MSFATNLTRARSHLLIVLGLVTASALIMTIEAKEPGRVAAAARPAPGPVERRAAAYALAQVPAGQRSPEMNALATRLGIAGSKAAPALSPAEATAILRSLDRGRTGR